ncbi:hypothetical protein OAF43_02180 [bacterium]|nr:hypothetical protein [bacterium]
MEQIAERIDTLEGANWHGYQGADILEPHLHRGIRNGCRLNDYQWYPLFREVVEGYPTFLDLRHFDNKCDSSIKNSDWMLPAWNAASWEGFKPAYGLAYWNTVESFRRTTRKVGTIQYTDPHTGIYCQLIDENQINTPEVPMMKILMIRNPRRANFYALKRFVEKLRFILIEKRGYDFAWGCPLEVDDPRYPVVGVDKRFKMHRELTFADEDGKTRKVIISRLAATWEAAGMILMPVPDDLIGAAFCSDKYKDYLLKKNKFMNQFLAPISPPLNSIEFLRG